MKHFGSLQSTSIEKFFGKSTFLILMIKKLIRTVTYFTNFGFLDPLRSETFLIKCIFEISMTGKSMMI